MSKQWIYICTCLSMLTSLLIYADASEDAHFEEEHVSLFHDSSKEQQEKTTSSNSSYQESLSSFIETPDSNEFSDSSFSHKREHNQERISPTITNTKKENFKPFTGKVKAKKVRMRAQADVDSYIIKELDKGEFVAVVGEKGDFYAVEPPAGLKAYVFRSFVLDNTVEGNHVNIRLQPSLDGIIVGHFNSGDKITDSKICATSGKWLEIPFPTSIPFYIAKNYIDNFGPPEIKAQFDARKYTVKQLFHAAEMLSKTEMEKAFSEIDFDKVSESYKLVINEYSDFPKYVERAKESLASLQEQYIDKRISYLEDKSQNALAESNEETTGSHFFADLENATDKMKIWEPLEDALYLTWSAINDSKSIDEYYTAQNQDAVTLTGILEPYTSGVKSKPGDFIIKDKEIPLAYVYSTKINLQNLIGKKITVVGSPRPNNNFAFPAFYVLDVK